MQEGILVQKSRWNTSLHLCFLLKSPMNDSKGIQTYGSIRPKRKERRQPHWREASQCSNAGKADG